MSRFDELKKQYKEFNITDLDLMKMASPNQENKYVELLAKLIKNHPRNNNYEGIRQEYIEWLVRCGIDYAYLETLETRTLDHLYSRLDYLIGTNNIKTFTNFAHLNERGLIENNDITSYRSFSELEKAISLAEMKLIDKELAKQIIKIHEDDTWLLLKPLSLEASMKYGASTKWCTTTDNGRYFAKYSKRGILIYAINKQTGFKFGVFKNLDEINHEREFSFWDAIDNRIEPLGTPEIPIDLLVLIKNEVESNAITNMSLMSEELQNKLDEYEHGEGALLQRNYEPLRFTSTGGNIGIGITTSDTTNISTAMPTFTTNTSSPTPPLSVSGNIEINDGDLIIRSNGEERMRITATGGDNIGLYTSQPVTNERIDEARERLEQAIEEYLAEQTSIPSSNEPKTNWSNLFKRLIKRL